MTGCKVTGCPRKVECKGWCFGHYQKWWKTGVEPTDLLRERRGVPPSQGRAKPDPSPQARARRAAVKRRWKQHNKPRLNALRRERRKVWLSMMKQCYPDRLRLWWRLSQQKYRLAKKTGEKYSSLTTKGGPNALRFWR